MEEFDKTDLMLLQHPEMWGNDYPNAHRDIISYGSTMKNTLIGPIDSEINSIIQQLEAMPTKLQLSWVAAVKKWNDAQAFKEDIYAIPRKGSESYAEVKSLRDHFNEEMKEPKVKYSDDDVELQISYINYELEGKEYTEQDLGKRKFKVLLNKAKIYPGSEMPTVTMPSISTDSTMSVKDMDDKIRDFLNGKQPEHITYKIEGSKTKVDKNSTSIMVERLQIATYGTTETKDAFIKAGFTEQEWKELLKRSKHTSDKHYELQMPARVGQTTEYDLLNL